MEFFLTFLGQVQVALSAEVDPLCNNSEHSTALSVVTELLTGPDVHERKYTFQIGRL